MSRLTYLENKIVPSEVAKRKIEMWHMKGEKVVFTNGCFDILHKGHVTYLAKAADFGNHLVVALNTDSSVKNQGKGDDRPINPEEARAIVIAGLGFVDLIVFFEDQTPIHLIEEFLPDVLVKGADYDPEEKDPKSKKYIVGREAVLANGGEVKVVNLVEGFSTTSILDKLKK